MPAKGWIALGVFAFVFVFVTSTFAYGPSIHMREAQSYIMSCELNPTPGPEHDPALLNQQRRFLLLGSIWPDLARVLDGYMIKSGSKIDENLVDPHNRHFNSYLLDDALNNPNVEPWKIAFAMGNLIHNAGDLVAQNMLVEHLNVRGHLGGLDVIVGFFDDHAGGEVEALVEGGMEFMLPAFDLYIEMANHFILSPKGRAELFAATDYYMGHYATYFGLKTTKSTSQAVALIEKILADPHRHIVPQDAHPGLYRFVASGFSDMSGLAGVTIDWAELLRVFTGPAAHKDFWLDYYEEGFAELSVHILRDFEPGQGYYDHISNWTSKISYSAVIQALAFYLPNELEVEDGRFLYNMKWTNPTGTSITSISSANPPAQVTITATFLDTPGRTSSEDVVTIRVREDSQTGQIVASYSADVAMDPFTYDVNDFENISVSFDPSPSIQNGANGFFVELVIGSNPSTLPYFTTDWSVYQQITQVDMTKAVYVDNHSTYGKWPYSLKINYADNARTSYFRFHQR